MARERDRNRKLFHKGHYEVIAARFREQISQYQNGDGEVVGHDSMTTTINSSHINALANLAAALAERFKFDNEEFDEDIFYERCGVHFE